MLTVATAAPEENNGIETDLHHVMSHYSHILITIALNKSDCLCLISKHKLKIS